MRTLRTAAARLALAAAFIVLLLPSRASALEKLCDPAFEDCRGPLITLINNEKVGLDVAFWFMTDTHFSDAILARWKAGVPVRVLMDTEANAAHSGNAAILSQLKSAGIPMREKTGSGILHWKMMIFAGQRTVEWSGANYSTVAFMPGTPYQDYEDEIIHFTDDDSLVNSFMRKYDDVWTTTSGYSNYANVTSLNRNYPTYAIDPELNFVPYEAYYSSRLKPLLNAETVGIDISMFRITKAEIATSIIDAFTKRHVPVRMIVDPSEYRNPDRLWDAYNVDRLYAAGIPMKFIAHDGVSHEKLVLLTGQAMGVFGGSNWSSPSDTQQLEHNLFTKRSNLVTWLRAHWERKWNNTGSSPETKAFTPIGPSTPTLKSPASGATGVATTVTLKWWAGKWAHKYDVYLGTSCNSMSKVANDVELGPSETDTDYVSYAVSNLSGNTNYCWKVVSRTMAGLTATSATATFGTGTASGGGGGGGGTITLTGGWTSKDIGSVGAAGTASVSGSTFTVKGSGADVWGTADEFRYVYKTLTGDGSITARVTGITNQNAWSKAGVMMRETLNAGSKHATMFVSSAKGLAFQYRNSTNGTSSSVAGPAGSAPYYVRITRAGTTFTGYVSSNGVTWTKVGSFSMNVTSTIYIGLAVTSHADGTISTGTFDSVQ